MTRPTKYTKTARFRSYAGLHPESKIDPTALDVEFDNLETSLGQTQAVLNKITRDDGRLAQASVTPESLDNATVAMISSRNARPRGEWSSGTEYSYGDWASSNGATYACLENHVSSDSISFDIASGYWQLVANNALTGYPNTADIFSGDGVTTDFDLSFIFPSPYSFFAFVDGKAQLPGLEFVLANNGRTIRFSSAPQVGVSNVFILASGGAGILSAVANSADEAANSARIAAERESGAIEAASAAAESAAAAAESAAAAAAAPVQSVAGKTGHVALTKADVGLANVDNTSDADKPVSTAVQAKFDALPGFASAAENAAGSIEDKMVDPLGIREAFNATGSAPVYACRAWVNFNGTGTVAIRASGNVSSITDNGTGDYTVNFTTALPDTKYAVTSSGRRTASILASMGPSVVSSAIGSVNIVTSSTSDSRTDWEEVDIAVFR